MNEELFQDKGVHAHRNKYCGHKISDRVDQYAVCQIPADFDERPLSFLLDMYHKHKYRNHDTYRTAHQMYRKIKQTHLVSSLPNTTLQSQLTHVKKYTLCHKDTITPDNNKP